MSSLFQAFCFSLSCWISNQSWLSKSSTQWLYILCLALNFLWCHSRAYVCVCACLCVRACVRAYMCTLRDACVCVSVWVCASGCARVGARVCVRHVCICKCIGVCIWGCVCGWGVLEPLTWKSRWRTTVVGKLKILDFPRSFPWSWSISLEMRTRC